MALQVHTSLMAGGLDLATPPIAVKPGKAIAGLNYEPDDAGYTSSGGYERFDGHPRPSDTTVPEQVTLRRAAIGPVPGTGPVRGVWVFDGNVYSFRDKVDGGAAGMYRADSAGWVPAIFGSLMEFASGDTEFQIGEYVAGVTSLATAFIDRVVLREGAWDGTAAGYLIVSQEHDTFTLGEELLSSSGSAQLTAMNALGIQPGGKYDFINHNFYGAASRTRMYFCSGTDTAFEWSGTFLSPIFTGITGGESIEISFLLAQNGDNIVADNGDFIIMSALFDAPSFIAHFKNHLFLGFTSGTIINSSLGEPLEFVTTTGAGEISFGEQITGLLSAAATSLMVFAQNRIEYITGDDTTTFSLNPISDASGAQPYTAQMMKDPMFLDDGGVRTLPTTSAFGDWRLGSVTQQIEKLIRQKREQGVLPVASLRIKAKDQYRLFWNDGTGLAVYIGRKEPETLPFKVPIEVFCACSGEVVPGQGDRLFVGCQDGFVYELNRGTSFDGEPIKSYIRLPFNAAGSPSQNTRWTKATFEIDSPDPITIGVAFDVDYAHGIGGEEAFADSLSGTSIITTQPYSEVDWTQPVEGRIEHHINGIGPNVSATLIHESAIARQHTISSQTYNFSRRGLKR
jgi:hypothetical protein